MWALCMMLVSLTPVSATNIPSGDRAVKEQPSENTENYVGNDFAPNHEDVQTS